MVEPEFFYSLISKKRVLPLQQQALRKNHEINYLSALNINSRPYHYLRSSIMCSIGPLCCDIATLERMINDGMKIALVNLSYGTRDYHAEAIRMIRQAEENVSKRLGYTHLVGIALDTRGPEIRMGHMDGDIDVNIRKGDTLKITVDKAYMLKGNSGTIFIDYENILKVVQPEDRIFICDGTVPVFVTGIHGSNIVGLLEADGVLSSCRKVYVPGIYIDVPALTAMDRADILFGLQHGVDYIIGSGVRTANDMYALRDFVGLAAHDVKIFAKIESYAALKHLDRIIDVADGIVINRYTIGVEIPSEKVFISQKNIIAKCNQKGKPVICAKHLMRSMLVSVRPTRAEVTDVANVVFDGADGIGVSETGRSLYPIECVTFARRVCIEAETSMHLRMRLADLVPRITEVDANHLLAEAAVKAAYRLQAAAIICLSFTGKMVQTLSKYRPNVPVITIVATKRVARQLTCFRSVFPVMYPDTVHDKYTLEEDWMKYIEDRFNYGILFGKITKFIHSGDPVVLVHGSGAAGLANDDIMRIEYVSDIVSPIRF